VYELFIASESCCYCCCCCCCCRCCCFYYLKLSVLQPTSTVVIQVTSLTLHPEASILDDPHVKQVFVAYKFLDYEPADLETPISLPKPAPHRPISFNFKKGKITLQSTFPRAFVTTREQCARLHCLLEATICKIALQRGAYSNLFVFLMFCPFFQFFMWMQRKTK